MLKVFFRALAKKNKCAVCAVGFQLVGNVFEYD